MVNYYYFMKHWVEDFDENGVFDAAAFLKSFHNTVEWWYSIDRDPEEGGDDPEWSVIDDFICFLDELSQTYADSMEPGLLEGEHWMYFLKGVTEDCYREESLDTGDGPSVCTFYELLESFGRGARILLTCPALSSYKVVDPPPKGLGIPTGQGFTLSILLSPVPTLCTFIAALGENNVGVPGDPNEFWKHIHALYAAGQPIGGGGWSLPPWLKK